MLLSVRHWISWGQYCCVPAIVVQNYALLFCQSYHNFRFKMSWCSTIPLPDLYYQIKVWAVMPDEIGVTQCSWSLSALSQSPLFLFFMVLIYIAFQYCFALDLVAMGMDLSFSATDHISKQTDGIAVWHFAPIFIHSFCTAENHFLHIYKDK